ncbi:MAG: DUF998 domain-containing protein [Promethearchaeota archaeon]|nr:MAG: DUF998 domain-containing protein [Candidatus Lokiarchaeota archaeon]
MNSKRIVKLTIATWPLSCVIGILIVLINYISLFISIALAPPPFSPLQNYMSSLGNSTYNPNGAIIYNGSVIVSGFLFLFFFIGLFQWYSDRKRDKIILVATQIVGVLLAFIFTLTGFYSEDFKPQHVFWSIVAGIFGFLANVFMAFYLIIQKESIKTISYFVVGFMGFYIIFLFILSPQHVLTEWVVRTAGDINFILMIINFKHIYQVRNKLKLEIH